jgi:hypothetical protein
LIGACLRHRAAAGSARWLGAALLAYGLQFAVGVGQVLMAMPLQLRWAHLALGAGFWGLVAGYWATTYDGRLFARWQSRLSAPAMALPPARESEVL